MKKKDNSIELEKNCSTCNKRETCAGCSPSGECSGNCCQQIDDTDATDLKLRELRGSCGGCCNSRGKLQSYNWLKDIPGGMNSSDMVEVEFKNTRKGFYRNSNNLDIVIGDMVAVESNPGHDIGRVTMTGKLVMLQMKKANLRPDIEILRIFRKAKASDLERFEAAKAKEIDTMIRSRKIAEDLKLNMKIGDVEYQGDGNKAIFYYIADERVDFRQLIKVLADTFKIRIEMKQIGARQEAGRIGGIGPCGRPLCCSSWMNNFVSVSTSAARYQDISLNPQKLAGQCAKLKCCLNFEVDAYAENVKKLPPRDVQLFTKDNIYYHFKTDIFKNELTYSTDKAIPANLVTITADRVFEVIALNKQGIKPDLLHPDSKQKKAEKKEFGDIIGQNSLTRFDKVKKKNGNRRGDNNSKPDERNRVQRDNQNKRDEAKPNQPQNTNQNPEGQKSRQQRDNRNNRNNRNRGPRPNRENQQRNSGNRKPSNNGGNENS